MMGTQKDATASTQVKVDADGIPIHTGPDYCPGCWVMPGVAHNLSCEQVTPEQFRAFLARR